MTTAKSMHSIAVQKGLWDEYIDGKVSGPQKILEQLLHVSIELMAMASSDNDDARLEESADVIIVLLDLAGAMGWQIDLEEIPPVSMENPVDLFEAVARLLRLARSQGTFNADDVISIIEDFYAMYGKVQIIMAVQDKAETNKTQNAHFGAKPFAMQITSKVVRQGALW